MANDLTSLRVSIVTTSGQEAGEAAVTLQAEDRRYRVQLRLDGVAFSGEGPDYFEALCEVRRKLERHNLLIRSYGASRNLVLSGMCRDMAAGLVGYRVTMGNTSVAADRVAIFDTGPDVEPVTVNEQQAFRDEWLRSIRGKSPDRAVRPTTCRAR